MILFSGHKAFVTSKMHLASVRESYRQLEDKTARLQEAFDRLKELDRLKSNFLATVSHELRTPLTSIIGYSEMLSEGLAGEMKPEQVDFVKTIHGKGEQLLSLIMGLLDLSKLESGTMRMTMRSMRIEPVLKEVVSTLAPTARKKAVKLEVDLVDGLADVRGDPERLRQVFLNLVENAIKFTPAQGLVTLNARMCKPDDALDSEEEGLALMAPTPASASPRASGPRSSMRSIRSTRRVRASTAAPGWGYPSSSGWWRPTVAASTSRATNRRGQRSSCRFLRRRRLWRSRRGA